MEDREDFSSEYQQTRNAIHIMQIVLVVVGVFLSRILINSKVIPVGISIFLIGVIPPLVMGIVFMIKGKQWSDSYRHWSDTVNLLASKRAMWITIGPCIIGIAVTLAGLYLAK